MINSINSSLFLLDELYELYELDKLNYMLIDELNLRLSAGRGGDGVVRWLHLKGKEFSGPAGGDGGRGADVYVLGVRDIGKLSDYRNKKEFLAEDGGNGKNKSQKGANGKDLVISMPVGSVITDMETGKTCELLQEGEKILLLKGGNGGYGNEHFKGSVNQRPKEWTAGKEGEKGNFYIELRLIADAGFVGLPNAGKTSLLNELTRAGAKVGAYQFTTLEPNLGAFYGFVLADIPGLIEGAAEGKGLGHKFLRHVRRTKVILHCVSLENEDLLETYDAVRDELLAYASELMEKKEIIILTKTDTKTPSEIKKAVRMMKKKAKTVLTVSILNDDELKNFKDELTKILRSD
ncbi:MAG: GTPase ObgE [bacterium]|nr:GTPase ObgE [bacterium]